MPHILTIPESNSSISIANNQLNVAYFLIFAASSLKKSSDFIKKILMNHFFTLDEKPHASNLDSIEVTAYFSDLAVANS